MGGPGPGGSDPGFMTPGAIFYEVRSVGQKSNGMLEQLFVRPSMAVLNAAADGSLYGHPGTGWDALPFGSGVPCGGGPGFWASARRGARAPRARSPPAVTHRARGHAMIPPDDALRPCRNPARGGRPD